LNTNIPSLETIGGWVAVILGSSGLGAVVNHWSQRHKTKAMEPAELIRAIGEASETMTGAGSTLMKAFVEEFKFLRKRIDELEEDLRTSKTGHQECEAQLRVVRFEIEELMRGRVAGYGEVAPKGDGI
jgi:hypothetical protein